MTQWPCLTYVAVVCVVYCGLFSGETSRTYWGTHKNTVAFLLPLVNSSTGLDFHQWNIIVSRMPKTVWDLVPLLLISAPYLIVLPVTILPFVLHFSIFISFPHGIFQLTHYPSDLVLHFNHFSSCRASLAACVSFFPGCIKPKLPVNVFLIACFYWKRRFPALLPWTGTWPCVHRAGRQTTATPTTQEYHYHSLANHCHVRNDSDTLVWPLCLAAVTLATGSLSLRGMCVPGEECHPEEF